MLCRSLKVVPSLSYGLKEGMTLTTSRCFSCIYLFPFFYRVNLIQKNEWNNIPTSIANKVGINIYKQPLNPICILKKSILDYFSTAYKSEFQVFEDFSPMVTTKQAFDDILIPKDHVSRRKNDSYYVDAEHVLRPHTSAHQVELLAKNINSFIVVGDVYRRDEVNRTHYPVFTQMEIVRTFSSVDYRIVYNIIESSHIFCYR